MSTLKKLNIKGKYLEIGFVPRIITQVIAMQYPNIEIINNDISPEMIKLAKMDLAEDLQIIVKYKIEDACAINYMKF